MKTRTGIFLALLASGSTATAVEAGPAKWLKEGLDYVTGSSAKNEAQERAAAEAARIAKQKLAIQTRNLAVKEITAKQLGRASAAFQIGAYTFTGAMVFNVLAKNGYAASETTYDNEQVAVEVAAAVAEHKPVYYEKYCSNPTNGEKYVVASWSTSCADGKMPVNGPGVTLAALRDEVGS